MKARNLKLTFEKAQEFYNSGNAALKKIASQVFTEDELEGRDFKCITTIYDALRVLDLNEMTCGLIANDLKKISKASAAVYKLNLIRQALNKGQKMSLTEGQIWYPQIRLCTDNSSFYKEDIRMRHMFKVGTIRSCGKCYHVLGGSMFADKGDGLINFNPIAGTGICFAHAGFLGCASPQIAEHMSIYFAKEIFEAMYSDFVNYEWI